MTAAPAPSGHPARARLAAIEADGVHVALADTPVLRGVSLAAGAGACVALVGPNGAGKSTLLRVLAGLIRPERGSLRLAGVPFQQDAAGARRAIGMVGHQAMVHPDLTARENLLFYARLYGLDRPAERVEAGLRHVGLLERASSRASTLSRGMTQRLALARALLHGPRVLLLDEAEAGLDAAAFSVLATTIRDRQAGRAVVLASHDLHRVHELSDAVVFLHRGRVAGTVTTAGLDVRALQDHYADAVSRASAPRQRGPATVAGASRS